MRLIDADANIETMKKCAANPESAQALLCYRFAQRILEEAPTVEPASPWHRVEEELPHKNGWYLVRDEFGDYNTLEWDNTFQWNGITAFGATLLTHWMPIEPPKEDV